MQPDFAYQSLGDDNGALSKQYALGKIRAEALPKAARGQGITVALIDSGVARAHESLNRDNLTLVDLVDEKETPAARDPRGRRSPASSPAPAR